MNRNQEIIISNKLKFNNKRIQGNPHRRFLIKNNNIILNKKKRAKRHIIFRDFSIQERKRARVRIVSE